MAVYVNVIPLAVGLGCVDFFILVIRYNIINNSRLSPDVIWTTFFILRPPNASEFIIFAFGSSEGITFNCALSVVDFGKIKLSKVYSIISFV